MKEEATPSLSAAYMEVLRNLDGTVEAPGKYALTGELFDIGPPKLGVDRSQGYKPSPDLVPVKQPASVIASFGPAPLVVPKEHIYFVQGEQEWARYLDGWTLHNITRVLKPACKRITLHLSHVTIDGPGASPVLTPSQAPRGTFGTLAIALPSTCVRQITFTSTDDATAWMPFTHTTMSFAAWYNDCTVTVAPITTPGHRAYLVYSLVSSDGEPHRTSPATTSSAAAELAALAAQTHQLDITYAYRLFNKTNDLRFEALQGRDAAFLNALVAAGTFDVALVRAPRQKLTRAEMHTEACNKRPREDFRRQPQVATAPKRVTIPSNERAPHSYDASGVKYLDADLDDHDESDTDASDAGDCSDDEMFYQYVDKEQPVSKTSTDAFHEDRLYFEDNAVDRSFPNASNSKKRRRAQVDMDDSPLAYSYGRSRYLGDDDGYSGEDGSADDGRDHSDDDGRDRSDDDGDSRDAYDDDDSEWDVDVYDFDDQRDEEFDDESDEVYYDDDWGEPYGDQDADAPCADNKTTLEDSESDTGVDAAYRKTRKRDFMYGNCDCDDRFKRKPWRRITEALLHPTSSDAMQAALLTRSVGRWITNRGLKRLRSVLLVFWPKRHRARILGLDAAVAALEKNEPSLLGFATTDDIAASLIDAFGAPGVHFTDVHVTAVGAYLLSHPSPTLVARFLPFSVTMRKRTSRRRGLRWFQAAIATFGVAAVASDILALCTPKHEGLYYLGKAIRWMRRLFVSNAAYVTQDGFGPLLVQCWRTLATQLAAIPSVDAYPHAMPWRLQPPMLQAALELEAAAAAVSSQSFPTSVYAFATTVYTTPEAVTAIVLPAVVQASPTTIATPFLPLLQRNLPTLHDALTRSTDIGRWILRFNDRFGDVLADYKEAAVLPEADYDVVRTLLYALRNGGMTLSDADATAMADDVLTRTRGVVVATVARQLKARGIPMSGMALVRTVTQALAACHLLSAVHVNRLVDAVTDVVFASDDALYYVRHVLYPVLRYLDVILTMYSARRDELATSIRMALEDALDVPDVAPLVQLQGLCTCTACTVVTGHLADQGPLRNLSEVVPVTCAGLRAAISRLPPHHPRVTLVLLGPTSASLRIWTQAGAQARRQRDEAMVAYLAGRRPAPTRAEADDAIAALEATLPLLPTTPPYSGTYWYWYSNGVYHEDSGGTYFDYMGARDYHCDY
ncbi:hypothetical protein SDRG_13608 [Saprolegnia diclina VS20]|uniref:Uncharacterized protein n=1 Tax=Saprolegnia diclina (strain VS20) TaxID=1156394 RepID=T0PT90_SAPDV|nr:hypothetical protein SDRG_13608 [Saprolegnia diclina VS20]EQC28734.1 hypothetical protein SDRG_13608 [Saprolegnia diclina VS20]|eukprot:XP_008617926.1 hypothetical protein SDRG_13608 [Saprolegnia diclina VS20]